MTMRTKKMKPVLAWVWRHASSALARTTVAVTVVAAMAASTRSAQNQADRRARTSPRQSTSMMTAGNTLMSRTGQPRFW